MMLPAVVQAGVFQNPLAVQYIQKILKSFILGVIYVGTPALAVFIVWTGFLFVAAQGNPEGLEKAKKVALYVGVGGVLLLGLWALVRLVGNTLAGLSSASLLILFAAFLLYVLYQKKK